jgi:PAS domain S-box-containing protein
LSIVALWCCLLVLAICVGSLLAYDVTAERTMRRAHLATLADVAQDLCREALRANGGERAERVLAGLSADAGVISAELLDADGRTVAAYRREIQPGREPAALRTADVTRDLREGDAVTGHLVLRARHLTLQDFLARRVPIGAPILIAALSLVLWLHRQITRPIRGLSQTVRKFSLDRGGNSAGEDAHEDDLDTLVQGVRRMIEDLRANNARLRESEARYRLLADNSQDTISLHTQDDRCLYVSPSIRDLLGFEPEEMVGQSTFVRVHPDDSAKLTRLYQDMLALGTGYTAVYRLRHKDGHYVWVETTVRLTSEGARPEDPPAIVASSRNVTARREMDEALRASEEKFSKAFHSSPLPCSITSIKGDGILVDANQRLLEMLGFTREQVIGRKLSDLAVFVDDESRIVWRNKLLRDGKAEPWEGQMRARDGRLLTVIANTALISIRSESFLLTSAQDVTELRESQKRLAEYQRQLRNMASELALIEERERRRLAAQLHDSIGQVLAITQMKLGVLQKQAGADGISRALEEMNHYVRKAIEHTRDLTMEMSPTLLYEVGLQAALEDLAARMGRAHGPAIHYIEETPLPPLSDDVKALLYRSTQELLFNAVKHAQATSVCVATGFAEDCALVRVTDNGRGFSPDRALPRVGDRNGFGLFSIRERLLNAGGAIEISTPPGGGSSVSIRCPLPKNDLQGASDHADT